jgi:hypothetical protein
MPLLLRFSIFAFERYSQLNGSLYKSLGSETLERLPRRRFTFQASDQSSQVRPVLTRIGKDVAPEEAPSKRKAGNQDD